MSCQSKEYDIYHALFHYLRDFTLPEVPSKKELLDYCESKVNEYYDPLMDAIYHCLDKTEYKSIFDIIDELSPEFPDITQNKVINRLAKLVKKNMIEKVSGMTNDKEAKKLMLYRLI